jgi:hypothetical protein
LVSHHPCLHQPFELVSFTLNCTTLVFCSQLFDVGITLVAVFLFYLFFK